MVERWDRGAPVSGDDGAGLWSTVFGVLVFLVLLLVAAHLLLGLFARSMASDAAMVGAQRMARGADATDARLDVAQLVGPALISAGPVAAADDPTADPDYIRYRVTIRSPNLAGSWLGPWATDPIVRDGRARVERTR